MNDEFKKLDELVQRNIPDETASLKKIDFPQTNSNWLKGLTLTASLAVVFMVNLNNRQFNEMEGLNTLDEVMSWDMSADQPLSEIEDAFELID